MAGLFDYEDPQSAGRLAFAAGLLNASGPQRMPVSFGQALAQALSAQQRSSTEAAMNQRRNALVDIQMQQHLMQLEAIKRQQAEEAQARALMRQYSQTPEQQAVSQFGGPTNAAAQAIPKMPGGFDVEGFRNAAIGSGNLYGVDLAPKLAKPTAPPLILKKGERGYDPRTLKPIEGLSNIEEDEQWVEVGRTPSGQILQQNKVTKELKAVGSGPQVVVQTGDRADQAFLKSLSEKEATRISGQLDEADRAKVSNAALDRIGVLLKNPAGLTTGPYVGDIVNNLRQIGATINVNVDIPRLQADAKYEAEIRGVLSDAILNSSVGRSMTNEDREVIKKAFVNRDIPLQAVPAFIEQAKERNNTLIRRGESIRQSAQRQFKDKTPFAISTDIELEPPKVPVGTESVTLDGRRVRFDGKGWALVP